MTVIVLGDQDAEASALIEYGITRIPTERFDVGGFSYSRLADAVAQAKRQRAAAGS
jgi:hypothetical protein